jgi:hypothetical protein
MDGSGRMTRPEKWWSKLVVHSNIARVDGDYPCWSNVTEVSLVSMTAFSGDSLQSLLLCVPDLSFDDIELALLRRPFLTFRATKDYEVNSAAMFDFREIVKPSTENVGKNLHGRVLISAEANPSPRPPRCCTGNCAISQTRALL